MTIDERGWILMSERYRRILISKNNGVTFTHFPFSMNISNSIIEGIFSDGNGGYYFSIDNKSFHYYYAVITDISYPFNSRILGVDEQGNAIFRLDNAIYIYLLSIKRYYPLSAPSFISSGFLRRIIVKGHNWIANVSKFGIYYSNNSGREWVNLKIGLGFVQAKTMYVTKNSKILLSAFSGGFWGNLYFSDDNGVIWYRHNPPKNPVFYDINKAPNGNLIAIGSYGIFVSSNDGLNWSNPIDSDLGSKVFVSKKGYIYCATFPNGLYISTNNGNTWFKPNNYDKIYFISFNESSSGRLFAASVQWYSETKLYYSDDNGLNWIRHNQHFSEIYDFLVKGDSIFLAASTGIYLSTDNGQRWNLLNYQFISKMMLTPNGDFLAINFGQNRLLKSTNNGKDWFYWDGEIKNRKIIDLRFDYEIDFMLLLIQGFLLMILT